MQFGAGEDFENYPRTFERDSEMLIDEGQTFIDFDGSQKETRELFVDYDMVVTPTLILLDHTGKQLGDKLIGLNTVELYGWYLENAIVYARSLILKSGIH